MYKEDKESFSAECDCGHYECEMCEKVQEEWDRLIDQGNYPKTEEEVEVYNNKE